MTNDLQKRVIFGGIALAIFIPFLLAGGMAFQFFVGLLAIISKAEFIKMYRLETNSIEG
ncbi:phosphatidate cytidylyltransferase, partial [Streptococcus suis]